MACLRRDYVYLSTHYSFENDGDEHTGTCRRLADDSTLVFAEECFEAIMIAMSVMSDDAVNDNCRQALAPRRL